MPRGYPLFEMIGDRCGPMELSAIPIGAYKPRWFMKAQHVDPTEAVAIHKAVRSRRSVGVHWGTWPLADEGWREPVEELEKARVEAGVAEDEFVVVKHGEMVGTREIGEGDEDDKDDEYDEELEEEEFEEGIEDEYESDETIEEGGEGIFRRY